eukprot:6208564-Pleurochrysis_carterae.AAC.8
MSAERHVLSQEEVSLCIAKNQQNITHLRAVAEAVAYDTGTVTDYIKGDERSPPFQRWRRLYR